MTYHPDHPITPIAPIFVLEKLRENPTLHLDGPIVPALRPIFLSGTGNDASGFAGRGVDISYGSIGGGDDAFMFGRRDTDDASADRDGEDIL